MKAEQLANMRRAWRRSSSRFFSPALWMSNEELEVVAARVKGCPVSVIHRAVQTAEAASDVLERSNIKANGNGEIHDKPQPQAPVTESEKSKINSRSLKIEAIGDFAYRKIKPRIRLSGHWLEKAGFKPGHRVQIHLPKPGEMTLQFKEHPPPLTADDSTKR